MDLKNSILILFYYLILSSFLYMVNGNEPELEDESSFSYNVGAKNGPQNWGNLNPSWRLCGTGTNQSPIDIIDRTVVIGPSRHDLIKKYKPAPAIIRDTGNNIEVQWRGDAGGITINGIEFKLEQTHWHLPTEHTLNGVRFEVEQHIVHRNSQGGFAVIGILYKSGPPDSFVEPLLPYLKSVRREGTDLGVVDPSSIKFDGREYYRYNGSLTTPPCTENIIWTLFRTVRTVSTNQIIALKNALNDGNTGNARPIQPLNARTVYLFRSIF